MPPFMINIVAARSGTGKTTLIEKLLPELAGLGLRVAALKGNIHHYDLDLPGKDTWRYVQAGAEVAGMLTPEKYILIGQARASGGLSAAGDLLRDLDLLLIEGDKQSSNPKIEVVREAVHPSPAVHNNVIAVATDITGLEAAVPVFSLQDYRGLARFIYERCLAAGAARSAAAVPSSPGAGMPHPADRSLPCAAAHHSPEQPGGSGTAETGPGGEGEAGEANKTPAGAASVTEGAGLPTAGGLTHFDRAGRARMVDVSAKEQTIREAYARGEIVLAPATLSRIREGSLAKGDVLGVAQVAAVMAVKETGRLIPMCHPLNISGVEVDFTLNDEQSTVEIGVRVKLTGQTGVEMEALTGVGVAALTIYDMCKAADKTMVIQNIRLVEKKGGRSGHYCREE